MGTALGQRAPDAGSESSIPTVAALEARATNTDQVHMRLLILAGYDEDYGLAMLEELLGYVGVPYDVFITSERRLRVDHLVDDRGRGRYQGVILASGDLNRPVDGQYRSTFDEDEWALLWAYQRLYRVRELTLYGYPGSSPQDHGLRADGPVIEITPETSYLQLTDAGHDVFSDLIPGALIPIRSSYGWPARVTESAAGSVVPLLQTEDGRVVAALSPTDGRERLVLTISQNPWVKHSKLLGYDLLRWVTGGVFLGERRVYLNVDVDDWFQFSDVWSVENHDASAEKYRISAEDVLSTVDQMDALRARYGPLSQRLGMTIAFVGARADLTLEFDCSDPLGVGTADPLSHVTACVQGEFDWLNHTFQEIVMDSTDYDTSAFQISGNHPVAEVLALSSYSRETLLTGRHSGLGHVSEEGPAAPMHDHGIMASNAELLRAAADLGVRFMGANMSVASHRPSCGGCGLVHPMEPSIVLIPRRPTSVSYNVTNPEEIVDQFNWLRLGDESEPVDYEGLLEIETERALRSMLSYGPYPYFFHQANLREYQPGRNLVLDWMDHLVARYALYFDLPLISLPWREMAERVSRHNSFAETGAWGVWDRFMDVVTIQTEADGWVYATGVRMGTTESYGADLLAVRYFEAGAPVGVLVVR